MEYTDNEWESSEGAENTRGVSEQAEVPSSLLPTILYRLGLPCDAEEQTPTEADISVDDLLAKLKSDHWEERLAAVRALGKRDAGIPLEPLLSALNDEDASVRAATVHVLGHFGKRAPLPRLIAAFHDPDWHVRETVMFALAQQGQDTPQDVFMTALRDTDGSVREAARLALQLNKQKTYGQLWEQKDMQQNSNDTSLANGKQGRKGFPAASSDAWDSGDEGGGRNVERYGIGEQMQEYVPYEYSSMLAIQREKVTSFPRRSHKVWWAIPAIIAVLFLLILLMGAGIIRRTTSVVSNAQPAPISMQKQQSMSLDKLVSNPNYAVIVQKDVASALHLPPGQITAQLNSGQTMTAIAAAQRFSFRQLQDIELKAFQDLLDTAVAGGDIDQQNADQWTKTLYNDPQLLDRMTVQAFEAGTGKS